MVLFWILNQLIGIVNAQGVDILSRQYFEAHPRNGVPGYYSILNLNGVRTYYTHAAAPSAGSKTFKFFPVSDSSSGNCWGWVSSFTLGWVACSGGGGGSPTGPASGDLFGSYPNPTVFAINGNVLGNTTPTAGNVLVGSGSSWVTKPITGDISLDSAGLTLVGKINNNPLGSTTPSSGNILIGSGTAWVTRSVTGDITISSTGTAALASVLAAGSCGDSTHTCQITYDAKGRLVTASNVAIAGGAPSGSAGGDLSGTYPNPIVAKINGNTLGNTTPTLANILLGDGTKWESKATSGDATISSLGAIALAAIISSSTCGDSTHSCQISFDNKGRLTSVSNILIIGGNPTGPAGGDLSGTYPNPLVAKLQGSPLAPTMVPYSGYAIIGDGSTWYGRFIHGDLEINGLGESLLMTVNSSPGTCGDSTHVCQIVTNGKGLVTSQIPVAIAGGGGGGSVLNLNRVTKTSNYTITNTDFSVWCDATSGAVTIAFPVTPTDGQVFSWGKVDLTTNACNLAGNGHDINDTSSLTVTIPYTNMLFQYDGGSGKWRVI